jgi:hypothetical protein
LGVSGLKDLQEAINRPGNELVISCQPLSSSEGSEGCHLLPQDFEGLILRVDRGASKQGLTDEGDVYGLILDARLFAHLVKHGHPSPLVKGDPADGEAGLNVNAKLSDEIGLMLDDLVLES